MLRSTSYRRLEQCRRVSSFSALGVSAWACESVDRLMSFWSQWQQARRTVIEPPRG